MAVPRLVLWGSAVAVLFGLTYGIGGHVLLEPDEGRNAEIAREMAETDSFVLPRLNGLPYLDKPVLYFATGAVAMKAFGVNATAARLPSLVFTLLTLAVVVSLGYTMFGTEGAWTAGIAFGASPFTVTYARVVIFDSAVAFFVTLACAAFFFASEAAHRRKGNTDEGYGAPFGGAVAWSVVAWAAIGLGILTKGPVALVLPLLIVGPYAAWRGTLRTVFEPAGILTCVAIVLPWVLAIERRIPGFLRYVFVVETAERLFTDRLGRSEPFWYFLPIMLGAAFPWTGVVLGGLRSLRRRATASLDRRTVFLSLWIVLPLLLFTLSQSKRPQYILPLVPAVALLIARMWSNAHARMPGATVAGAGLTVLGLVLASGAKWIPSLFETTDAVRAAIPPTALALGAVSVVAGLVTVTVARHRHAVLLAFALPVTAIPVIGAPLLRAIADDRSTAGLVEAMGPAVTAETELIAVGVYPLSLPFYAERTVLLATNDGRELTSNYVARHVDALRRTPNTTLRPANWWLEALALCDRPRVFIVPVEARAIRNRLRMLPLLGETRKLAAYGPCGRPDLALDVR